MKQYTAFYDDGHDYGEFKFYSCHRANSKANLADAYSEAKKKFGLHRASCIEIKSTQRCYNWEE